MDIDLAGYLRGACLIASPNCDARPAGCEVTLLVIHNISLPPDEFGGEGVAALFTNQLDPAAHPYYQTIANLRVSSHFFIRRDGEIVQFVACGMRAWHAGVSCWHGRECCNDFSVGIELEGSDTIPFTDAQYTALVSLTAVLSENYPVQGIAGHADIAAGRKTDPGPCFDWVRYCTALMAAGYDNLEFPDHIEGKTGQ